MEFYFWEENVLIEREHLDYNPGAYVTPFIVRASVLLFISLETPKKAVRLKFWTALRVCLVASDSYCCFYYLV